MDCFSKLLNEEEFQKYLQRSLATAESQAANSFHCQTPNCQGWCIYDDEVNDFDCPVCQKRNCLTCKAIHFPVNCKEYQDDLKRNAANDEAARKTKEYLEVGGLMIEKGRVDARDVRLEQGSGRGTEMERRGCGDRTGEVEVESGRDRRGQQSNGE